MYIRCPKCGRRGQLPDRWVSEAQTLRCRRCRAMFKMPELARLATERETAPAFDSVGQLGRDDEPSSFIAEGFFSGFDDTLVAARQPGPGDSNYELTFTLRDDEGDSGSAWDAAPVDIVAEPPSSDEIPDLSPAAAKQGPDPWPNRFVETWGPRLIVSALVLLAALVPTTAYLAWQAIRSGPDAHLSTPALIAGFACTAALLMIAVPLTLLAASLSQLARDIRSLSQQAERHGIIVRR